MSFYVLVGYYEFNEQIENKKSELREANLDKFNSIVESQNSLLETVGTNLINNSVVIQGYKDDDARAIADEVLPIWKKLTDERVVSEIHFFKPPAISFVNLSNLVFKEVDVSKVRTDVTWSFDSCESGTHMFACRKYVGFRKVFPMFKDSGEVLGILSVGRDLDVIPEEFNKNESKIAFSAYHKEEISSIQKDILTSIINNSTELNGHLFLNEKTGLEIDFLERLHLDNDDEAISYHGDEFFVTYFKINDFEKEELGHIIIVDDITKEYEIFFRKALKNLIFLILLMIVAYLILSRNIYKMTKKITTISKFGRKLQNRNFGVLESSNFRTFKDSENELDILSYNLYRMGIALRELYQNQQNKIDESTVELENMIYRDTLTGLPNRKAIDKDLKVEKAEAVIVLDIDNFSQINNFLGTNTGNIILIETAKYLTEFISDFSYAGIKVYRIGSDEFGILYRDCKLSVDDFISQVIERASEIRIKNLPDAIDFEIDLSIGISKNSVASVENSDVALHRAKDSKASYYIYDDDIVVLQKEQEKNIHLLTMVKNGILDDRFIPFFQPIFNEKREIVKYEALIRLFDGEKYLTPYHFLPYAKKTKYYFEITKIVVKKSLERFQNTNLAVSINLSVDDILNKEITDFITEQVKNYPKPENITFELLESEQIENFEEIKEFIENVKKYGVKIAIDDFGSGYSNFSYLVEMKPDILKIDGSLIKGILTDKNSALIIELIVKFAHKSGFTVVAEFVDSEEILNKGIELEIDYFQGFYLAKPSKDI
jgi:diguanylate cyclase (GGDEF)-like protein